jgi:hypothetical protein
MYSVGSSMRVRPSWNRSCPTVGSNNIPRLGSGNGSKNPKPRRRASAGAGPADESPSPAGNRLTDLSPTLNHSAGNSPPLRAGPPSRRPLQRSHLCIVSCRRRRHTGRQRVAANGGAVTEVPTPDPLPTRLFTTSPSWGSTTSASPWTVRAASAEISLAPQA